MVDLLRNITREAAAKARSDLAAAIALYYGNASSNATTTYGNASSNGTHASNASATPSYAYYQRYNFSVLTQILAELNSYNETQLTQDLSTYLQGQQTLRPVSQVKKRLHAHRIMPKLRPAK